MIFLDLRMPRMDGAELFHQIKAIKPNVLVKGADWKLNKIVGADFVKSYGGRVAMVPFVRGRSTSSIIHKIINRFK